MNEKELKARGDKIIAYLGEVSNKCANVKINYPNDYWNTTNEFLYGVSGVNAIVGDMVDQLIEYARVNAYDGYIDDLKYYITTIDTTLKTIGGCFPYHDTTADVQTPQPTPMDVNVVDISEITKMNGFWQI